MTVPAAYLPEARDDVDAAYTEYERRLAGLGDRFLEALRDRVDQIRANPALYGVPYQDVRAAPLRRFPYVVYYRAQQSQVVVIAVQRGRRSSQSWQTRA